MPSSPVPDRGGGGGGGGNLETVSQPSTPIPCRDGLGGGAPSLAASQGLKHVRMLVYEV